MRESAVVDGRKAVLKNGRIQFVKVAPDKPKPAPIGRLRLIKRDSASMFGVDVKRLDKPDRDRIVTKARHAAMYAARHALHYTFHRIAEEFGLSDQTGAIYAVKRVPKKKEVLTAAKVLIARAEELTEEQGAKDDN